MWGQVAAAVGQSDDVGNNERHFNTVEFAFMFTVPIAYGKGPKFGKTISVWAKEDAPTRWFDNPRREPDEVHWTAYEDEVPIGFDVVDHIQCCKGPWGASAGWPMPTPTPPLPAVPPVAPAPLIIPSV
jgi:hypothetical protein